MNTPEIYKSRPRDEKRIYPFCNQLAQLWSVLPDIRFGQLMHNVAVYTDANYGKDVFYIEDDEFMKILQEYLGENRLKHNNKND